MLHGAASIDTTPPGNVSWLVALVGAEAALRLIEALGGTRLYIPYTPQPGQAVVELLGAEAAGILGAERGGETVKLPLCREWRARVYRSQGRTHREIARTLSADIATVERWTRRCGDSAASAIQLSLL